MTQTARICARQNDCGPFRAGAGGKIAGAVP